MKWNRRADIRDRELHYRPELDGLRGLAILAVLGFHAFPALVPGGFVGVDVFFVLSGFLICAIILEQLRASTFTLAGFYIRRARRLFPALAIVLAVCLLFGWFVLLPDEYEILGRHVGAAAAFVLNFAVWREGGYFDPAANLNPVLHLWSLGIEEQFYLVWPLVLMLLWAHKRTLAGTVAALVAASFALNIVFTHTDPRGDFFLPVTRFWELGLGCMLAVFQDPHAGQDSRAGPDSRAGMKSRDFIPALMRIRAWARIPARVRAALPIAGFALICGAAFLFHSRVAFPGWAALVPAAGAMCVICASPEHWFQRRVMASAPLVFVGVISYPLYLWHWPLLSFATILGSGVVPVAVRAAAVVLSFGLAYLVFRLVEIPVRARPALRTGGMLAAGLGTLGLAGLLVYAAAGIKTRFGHDVRSLQTASRVNHYCLRTFGDRQEFNYCKSTSAASPEVVFLGDSRTQAVYDGMVSLAGHRFAMMLLARGGCPPMLGARGEQAGGHRLSCDETWSAFVKYVRELNPRVVVLVGGGSALVGDGSAQVRDPAAQSARPGGSSDANDGGFKNGLSDLIAALPQTAKVIYVRETPVFDTGPACFLRPFKVPWGMCSPVMHRATIEQRMSAYNREVNDIGGEFPALTVVDSIQALCGSSYCVQQLRSGEILYRDRFHLTSAGAKRLDNGSGLYTAISSALQSPRPPRSGVRLPPPGA